MKILQRNLNWSTFGVWEMKRNVYVVRSKFRCSILISGKIIKEIPVSVASGTQCITNSRIWNTCVTWQGINYKLSEDDTIVPKHVWVW